MSGPKHNHTICTELSEKLSSASQGALSPSSSNAEFTNSIDITGKYEMFHSSENPAHQAITSTKYSNLNHLNIQFNQAGRYAIGWYQKIKVTQHVDNYKVSYKLNDVVVHYVKADGNKAIFHYQLLRSSDGTPYSEGTLTFYYIDKTLFCDLASSKSNWKVVFARTSTVTSLPDSIIDAIPGKGQELVRATQRAPFDSYDDAHIAKSAKTLAHNIEVYFKDSNDLNRVNTAVAISKQINKIRATYPEQKLPIADFRLKQALLKNSLKIDDTTRSYWDWIQIMYQTEATGLAGSTIQSNMGRIVQASGQHHYEFTFLFVGLAGDLEFVGAGGFILTVIVEKKGPDTWKESYMGVIGQVGASASSLGFVIGTALTGKLSSSIDYSKNDFAGMINMVAATGGGFSLGAGVSVGACGFIFYGEGTTTPAEVTDTSLASGHSGAHYAVGAIDVGVGYLSRGKITAKSRSIVRPPSNISFSHSQNTNESVELHFATNKSELTPCGWQILREYCATYRVLFESPNSKIEILGYTSTTAKEDYNLTLSQKRAQATYQAIVQILGAKAYKIKKENTTIQGLGEAPARAAGSEDKTEDPKWRKVSITLNDTVTLNLNQ